ncbi:MAG: flagellar biosynthetic protein FliO [Planctomycetes bacterium]|nr:flagellar biosynthetic protein FliO [Planctomycetota bacterium]MBM4058431.1 flagellar biosynthetic protein FliO [Planctomycetota bacterium]
MNLVRTTPQRGAHGTRPGRLVCPRPTVGRAEVAGRGESADAALAGSCDSLPWSTRQSAVLATVCWAMLSAATWADEPPAAPAPPLPDEYPAEVAPPATFEPVVTRAPADGPLPLTGRSTVSGAQRLPAARPLGDWTVLLAVAAAFAVLVAFRMRSIRRMHPLPPDVFDVLGEASLGGQRSVRVVRFGPRTLLIGVSAAGCQPLAEIDDPQATEKIAAACRGDRTPVRGPRRESPRPAPSPPTHGEAA